MALRHFKVSPVLKIDETVYKEAESMCARNPAHSIGKVTSVFETGPTFKFLRSNWQNSHLTAYGTQQPNVRITWTKIVF